MNKKLLQNKIAKLMRMNSDVPDEVISLIDKAVGENPADADLWHKRGHLIQLGSETIRHTLEDALASYFTALRLDPENPEIIGDIAHFFDAVMADETEGKKWFAKLKQQTSKDNNVRQHASRKPRRR